VGDVHQSLLDLQNAWEETEPATVGEFAVPPVGKHQVRISSAEIIDTKNGRCIRWEMKGLSKEVKGETYSRLSGIEEPVNISYVKSDLMRLNIAVPSKIKNIQKALDRAEGLTIEITVKEKDGYTNIYFNRVLQSVGAEEPADEGDDDDF
jgi:hypothetical protein